MGKILKTYKAAKVNTSKGLHTIIPALSFEEITQQVTLYPLKIVFAFFSHLDWLSVNWLWFKALATLSTTL